MAVRKTGSRRIVVDGVEYRWRISHRATYLEQAYATAMVATVEHGETPGQTLVIYCGARPGNWLALPGVVVTPRQIATAIRSALAAGWQPTEQGRPFETQLPSADES